MAVNFDKVPPSRHIAIGWAMSLAPSGATRTTSRHARDLLAPAYGEFTEGFETVDLKVRRRCWRGWRHNGSLDEHEEATSG